MSFFCQANPLPDIRRRITSTGHQSPRCVRRIVSTVSWESLGTVRAKRGRTLRNINGGVFEERLANQVRDTIRISTQHFTFAMSLDFATTVTLNRHFCHPECYLTQLNAYMRNTTNPNQLWKMLKGGPANGTNGECGREHNWGFCTKAAGNPGPPTNIVSAVVFVSFHLTELVTRLSRKRTANLIGKMRSSAQ